MRVASYKRLNPALGLKWINSLKRWIASILALCVLSTGSQALAVDEPDLIDLPEMTYPIQKSDEDVAKFINRCVEFELAAKLAVEENNKIWTAHERLVAVEEYNRGLDDAMASSQDLKWYHWLAAIGGAVAAGSVMGFVVAIAVVE
jgi:hypothetical protein